MSEQNELTEVDHRSNKMIIKLKAIIEKEDENSGREME
jgi:hypothetical protein